MCKNSHCYFDERKIKTKSPKPKCNKCGEVAPIDNEMSNDNWMVYKTKEPCKCGGKFKIDFSSEEGE